MRGGSRIRTASGSDRPKNQLEKRRVCKTRKSIWPVATAPGSDAGSSGDHLCPTRQL